MSKKDQFIRKFRPEIDNFLQLVRDNRRHQKENAKSFSTFDSPIVIIVTFDQLTDFNDIIVKIAYYKDFYGNFSTNYVENELFELLHKILSDFSRADEYIGELYTNFIGNLNNEWRIITQLENVRFVERAVYKLIDSTLKWMKPQDLIDCTLKLMKPEDLSISSSSLQQEFLGAHYSNWVLSHCIYTDVKAGDQSKAEELAIDNFNLSINLLRLYFSDLNIIIKRPVSLSEKQEKIAYEIISTNITKKCAKISVDKGIKRCHDLNPKRYEYLVKNGISSLSNDNQISCKYKITDVVKDCLYWYGLALDTGLLSAKLLHYVTILESGLKMKDEKTEVTQKIADRCALFLETDFNLKKGIISDIKEIYNLRSTVVHTGNIIGRNPEMLKDPTLHLRLTESAGIYAIRVLKKLIRENDQLNGDFSKFIQDLDDMKYKERFYVLTIRDS